jgi:3-deoxy-D-manno-octulosonic-acid transferase
LLEPAAPLILRGRLKRGKERPERLQERLGLTAAPRPEGLLIWMHGASVGECRLLLDTFRLLAARRPGVQAVVTSQTLTAADMIAAGGGPGVVHQMAPVDAPAFVKRFLDHWRPDLAVFAEGEIWPNMLAALRYRWIPAALINARMTGRTLSSWRTRQAAARTLFEAFRFIGAADTATAVGLGNILHRRIAVVGNLKQAMSASLPSADAVATWRRDLAGRPVVLAASTHPGEDELALAAFNSLRETCPTALMLLAPRHPDRGARLQSLAMFGGYRVQRRSAHRATPTPDVDVLVADTMGEMPLWYVVSTGIYLAGAHAPNIGGHNAAEPVQLGRRVFTGPNGFNFRDTFQQLEQAGALVIGPDAAALADFWRRCVADPAWASLPPSLADELFESARAPLQATLEALVEMLPSDPPNA